jgi:hypothetical protein
MLMRRSELYEPIAASGMVYDDSFLEKHTRLGPLVAIDWMGMLK